LANVKDSADQSIFGGFSGNKAPFLQDEQGNVTFQGDTNVQQVEIADGVETEANGSGFGIFMQVQVPGRSGVQSIFQLIGDVVEKLNQGKSCADELTGVTASLDQVNNAQMLAGTRLSKITRQQETLAAAQLQAKTMLSTIEDTDIEKVVTELRQKMLSLEASQASFVKIADLSLFNYLR
jgi:flagellar hook-associated protein 3 FlgL